MKFNKIKFTYYVIWSHRKTFFLLIDKFLNKQMVGREFCILFTEQLEMFDVEEINCFMDKTTLKNFQKFESVEASIAERFAQELYTVNQDCLIFEEFEHRTDLKLLDFTKARFLFYLKNFNLDINPRDKEFFNIVQRLKNRPLLSYSKNDVNNLLQYYVYSLRLLFLWTYRDSYHKLLLDFINNKISAEDFRNRFSDMESSIGYKKYFQFRSKLKTSIKPIMSIPLDSRAFQFGFILSRIEYNCHPDSIDPYEVDDEELYEVMKQVTSDLEKLMKQAN